MKRVVVLGAGMVGRVMAEDMCQDKDWQVTIADRSQKNLSSVAARLGDRVTTVELDCKDTDAVRLLAKENDLVLGALSSQVGLTVLEAVIESGRPYCDISFMPERAADLDKKARQAGVCAVVDFGVAPGMSHLMAAYGVSQLDEAASIEIYVGGLPREPVWPFFYKAGFSPADVLEEYTRPTRLIEGGKVIVREALTEPEMIDFEGVGSLEAVNTDGLRSLVETLDVPDMKEKTLRYPGHYELMRIFRATGLFSTDPIEVNGKSVIPREVTSALLFPLWTYEPGEQDLTVMRIIVDGTLNGKAKRIQWDLTDFYSTQMKATSMSRTTAFPCTILGRMLEKGAFNKPGVHTPELLATEPGLVEFVLAEHEARGVHYHQL